MTEADPFHNRLVRASFSSAGFPLERLLLKTTSVLFLLLILCHLHCHRLSLHLKKLSSVSHFILRADLRIDLFDMIMFPHRAMHTSRKNGVLPAETLAQSQFDASVIRTKIDSTPMSLAEAILNGIVSASIKVAWCRLRMNFLFDYPPSLLCHLW
jgi:hypothetical protein